MQRLEAEATLDEQSMNPELDALLERPFDEEKFRAWSEGTTGWPFFDACMRYLRATGWINFRMRAMLQSVASYTLWLPWKTSGAHLARQFLDYEPGDSLVADTNAIWSDRHQFRESLFHSEAIARSRPRR